MSVACPIFDSGSSALASVIASSLIASPANLTIWMGAGRRALEHAWASSPLLAVSLTASLSELNWGGFSQFGLPVFLKNSISLLKSDDTQLQLRVLRCVSKLAGDGSLKDCDATWKEGFSEWLSNWASGFVVSPCSVR